MLTLDATMKIPAHVSFSVVGEDAILLNTRTNQYFALEEVGARLWALLEESQSLKEAYQVILREYQVGSHPTRPGSSGIAGSTAGERTCGNRSRIRSLSRSGFRYQIG
jgi:hypothetical protein